MLNIRLYSASVLIVLVMGLVGCAPSFAQTQQAVVQTVTPSPLPTFTPDPTSTPYPTATPPPAFTPTPKIIPGIDVPVSVLGATFKFYAVNFSTDPISIGNKVLTPKSGKFVLVLCAVYTGKVKSLLRDAYHDIGGFFVVDSWGDATGWSAVYVSGENIDFGFIVNIGRGPYVLHNTIGESWSINLAPLIVR